eukprot:scaffold1385_cov115-Isochrysis_galbana.AAC.1
MASSRLAWLASRSSTILVNALKHISYARNVTAEDGATCAAGQNTGGGGLERSHLHGRPEYRRGGVSLERSHLRGRPEYRRGVWGGSAVCAWTARAHRNTGGGRHERARAGEWCVCLEAGPHATGHPPAAPGSPRSVPPIAPAEGGTPTPFC